MAAAAVVDHALLRNRLGEILEVRLLRRDDLRELLIREGLLAEDLLLGGVDEGVDAGEEVRRGVLGALGDELHRDTVLDNLDTGIDDVAKGLGGAKSIEEEG